MTILDQLSQVHFLALLFFGVLQLSLHVFGTQLQETGTAVTAMLHAIVNKHAKLNVVDSHSNSVL